MKRIVSILILSISMLSLAAYGRGAADVETVPEVESAEAASAEVAEAGETLDIKSVIFGHTNDSYEWHITDIGDKSLTVWLPVIVRSSDGWHVFSSRRLEEGTYKGLYIAESGDHEGKIVEKNAEGEEVRPLDISITKNVASMMFSGALLVFLVLSSASWYKRHDALNEAPKGIAAIVEPILMFVHSDIVKDCIGEDYRRYSPFLCTAFFWILINNLLGLIPFIPGGANVTGNIAVTLVLALCTFVLINLFGTKHYYKDIFWPDVPWWLKFPIPLMPVIEIFSALIKPVSLMIRLFANMLAGHIVIISLVCVIFLFAKYGALMSGGMTVIALLMGVFMSLLEVLVAFLQAYIFTILSAVFIGLSRQK